MVPYKNGRKMCIHTPSKVKLSCYVMTCVCVGVLVVPYTHPHNFPLPWVQIICTHASNILEYFVCFYDYLYPRCYRGLSFEVMLSSSLEHLNLHKENKNNFSIIPQSTILKSEDSGPVFNFALLVIFYYLTPS